MNTRKSTSCRLSGIDTFLAQSGFTGDAGSSATRAEVEFVANQLRNMPRARILDLPCGTGRHTHALSMRGFAVLGVDISAACIGIARVSNSCALVNFKRLNLLNIARLRMRFDAVISLLSCIGYFRTEQENARAFRALASVVKPGGRLILSTANRIFVERAGNDEAYFENAQYVVARTDHYDPTTRYLIRTFLVREKATGRRRRYSLARRLYSKSEMTALIRKCGFISVQCFSDFKGGRFIATRSPHAVYVATKLCGD